MTVIREYWLQLPAQFATSPNIHSIQSLASYPGFLTPVFVTCSTNAGEGRCHKNLRTHPINMGIPGQVILGILL